jgi:hypothetical protein
MPKNAPAASEKSKIPALAEKAVAVLLLAPKELAEGSAEELASVLSVALAAGLLASGVEMMLVSIEGVELLSFVVELPRSDVAGVELLAVALSVATALARCE